jgi:predicted acyl esterase
MVRLRRCCWPAPPYGKDQLTIGGSDSFDILRAVQAGYVVVAQDVRGRNGSDGEFEPNVNETRDGVDMIAWAAAQPWSSGVVGTFGGSYLGGTQWLPARQNPPALKAMAPAVTFSDMHEGCCYQGGANVLHSLRWVVEDIAPAELRRRAVQNPAAAPADVELDLYTTLNELPLGGNPLIRDAAPFYLERLAHPTPGDYWLAISPNSGYGQITAPSLNIGGWYDLFQWGTPMGPRDQREVEVRDDVLVYTSPVLEQPVEVTGPIELRLWASSSAPDTDFAGKLVDVHPDGRAIILTDGVLRARDRNSPSAPELMEPGTPYELSLDLWATANVFLPGHHIRLEVASSNFPKFDRNSNTGGDITTESADQYQPAVNRILHDRDHPSRLILPIIER